MSLSSCMESVFNYGLLIIIISTEWHFWHFFHIYFMNVEQKQKQNLSVHICSTMTDLWFLLDFKWRIYFLFLIPALFSKWTLRILCFGQNLFAFDLKGASSHHWRRRTRRRGRCRRWDIFPNCLQDTSKLQCQKEMACYCLCLRHIVTGRSPERLLPNSETTSSSERKRVKTSGVQ